MHGFYKMSCRDSDLRWNIPSLKRNFSSQFICSTFPPGACVDVPKGSAWLLAPGRALQHLFAHAGYFPWKGKFCDFYAAHLCITQGITHMHRCTVNLRTHHRAGGLICSGMSLQNPGEGSQTSFLPIQGMRKCCLAA